MTRPTELKKYYCQTICKKMKLLVRRLQLLAAVAVETVAVATQLKVRIVWVFTQFHMIETIRSMEMANCYVFNAHNTLCISHPYKTFTHMKMATITNTTVQCSLEDASLKFIQSSVIFVSDSCNFDRCLCVHIYCRYMLQLLSSHSFCPFHTSVCLISFRFQSVKFLHQQQNIHG